MTLAPRSYTDFFLSLYIGGAAKPDSYIWCYESSVFDDMQKEVKCIKQEREHFLTAHAPVLRVMEKTL